MRRLLWMGVGAALAGYAARRLRRAAHRYTPEGLADRAGAVGQQATTAVHDAVAEFRTARETRERELVEALLVEPASVPERARSRSRTAADDDLDVAAELTDDEDDFF